VVCFTIGDTCRFLGLRFRIDLGVRFSVESGFSGISHSQQDEISMIIAFVIIALVTLNQPHSFHVSYIKDDVVYISLI